MATAIPRNRARFTVDEIALATGGRIVRGGGPSVGVSTDSRAIVEGEAFVALTGAKFDGHAFLASVVTLGARTLVVSKEDAPNSAAVVQVNDTRAALGDLARAHRVRWAGAGPSRSLVAITGSSGKTTTKTVLAAVLDAMAPGTVHATSGNLNNDVGVPLTLLGLDDTHRLAVVEMGTNARGEIANLSQVARPDVGVLTLVAAAHTEGLGTVDDVAVEKGALFEALPPGGLAVANADDARAVAQLSRTSAQTSRTYGFSPQAHYRIGVVKARGREGSRLRIAGPSGAVEAESPLLGEAGALAVAASVAVAEWTLGRAVRADELGAALLRLTRAGEGRLAPIVLADGTLIVDDSYNANPASMLASIRAASEIAALEKRRLVLVLGEMLELGGFSPAAHDELGRFVAGGAAAHVIAVGGEAERIAREVARAGKSASFARDAVEAADAVLARVLPGDLVLVKGSRGIATEKVVRVLVGARGQASSGGGGA